MRGQRCREYAIMMMTVIGMVGRGTVQGDAIREARAVNLSERRLEVGVVRLALPGAQKPPRGLGDGDAVHDDGERPHRGGGRRGAGRRPADDDADRAAAQQGRGPGEVARVDDEQVDGGHGVGPEARPQEDHPQQPWYPP